MSLRSTPCSHISLILFEHALGCRHLFGYSRQIEAFCWMKCRRMILKRYLKNPNVNESLNPDSLRSFLHIVTECNQISIKVVRIQNYYFGYSRTSRIKLSNLIDMHVDAGMCSRIIKCITRVAALNSCSHISLILSEDALGCRHLFCYSRHIEACCWMKCRRMILRRYLKNPY